MRRCSRSIRLRVRRGTIDYLMHMPLSSFQRLALWTTATTYFLILVGGLVRASGAGLGCPDWPRCFGSWIPPLSAAELPPAFDRAQFNPVLMWTEYLNRLLGVSVGIFIFATLVVAIPDQSRDTIGLRSRRQRCCSSSSRWARWHSVHRSGAASTKRSTRALHGRRHSR